MELRCPKCNSTNLKKVSLAYEEGLFRSSTRTGVRGVMVGTGGPGILVGSAASTGTHQTAVSRRLSPPKKWSYLKLIVGLAVVSFVALIVYVHSVMGSPSVASASPVKLYGLVASPIFVVLVLLIWRHNQSTYPQQFRTWNQSYLCRRCGTVSERDSKKM